ncbi:cytochrome c family protein [uncultured Roseovarius sp.]|uniref:c-type cytochrome n=1 Tax=uncultured Roseovarius sp. TaxID=293344 RepID=UPI0026266844|nr:cytochrome c family protein [uncultured Roseovarius sp.]
MFDTMTLTKIVGSLCGALLVLLMGKWAGELLYDTSPGHGDGHGQAYIIDTGSDDSGGGEAAEGPSLAELWAAADVEKGAKVFGKCKACHKLEDGANATGPYLYGVVGRDVSSAAGFSYSGSLKPVVDVWTPETLSAFLENPKGYAPGTSMGFSGLKKDTDRINVIAYLDQLDGDTYEMAAPEPKEEAAAEGAEAETEMAATEETAAEAVTAEAPAEAEVDPTPEAEAAAEEATTEEAEATEMAAAEEAPAEEVASEEAMTEEAETTEMAAAEEAPAEEAATEEAMTEEAETTEMAATEEAPAEEAATEEMASEEPAAEEAAGAEASGFAAMVASADAAKGEKVFKKCKACHALEDGKNRVGPHLFNLVDRPIGGVEGFKYSDALAGNGGTWTADELSAFLTKPKDYAPGTKMSFAGLRKEEDRAAVIAYIQSAAQ